MNFPLRDSPEPHMQRNHTGGNKDQKEHQADSEVNHSFFDLGASRVYEVRLGTELNVFSFFMGQWLQRLTVKKRDSASC